MDNAYSLSSFVQGPLLLADRPCMPIKVSAAEVNAPAKRVLTASSLLINDMSCLWRWSWKIFDRLRALRVSSLLILPYNFIFRGAWRSSSSSSGMALSFCECRRRTHRHCDMIRIHWNPSRNPLALATILAPWRRSQHRLWRRAPRRLNQGVADLDRMAHPACPTVAKKLSQKLETYAVVLIRGVARCICLDNKNTNLTVLLYHSVTKE
jgi:hypothetical protein